MEWKLEGTRFKEYDSLLKGAQDLEITIGSTQYRVHKLLNMRAELEGSIKKWWDQVLEEMKLEKNADYVITKDGTVQLVPRKEKPQATPAPQPTTPPQPEVQAPAAEAVVEPESKVGTNAEEIK